jgi:hypothetical protein
VEIPLPVGGVFSEVRTAEARNLFAAELKNFRSTGYSLELRQHYSAQYPENPSSDVFQVIPWEYAGANRGIKFAPTQAVAGNALATLTRTFSTYVDWAYLSNAVIMVDGTGAPFGYDGTNFTTPVFAPSTGKNPNDFDGIIAHNNRLYLWQEGDNLDFYYGGVGAITGAVTVFPLGNLGSLTGQIQQMASMSLNQGTGQTASNVLCIMTTTGDVAVYQGLDPGDATNWSLMAIVRIAPPLSKLSTANIGGDIWCLTRQGVVSLQQSLREGSMALVNTVTRSVQDDIIAAVRAGGQWQIHRSSDATIVIINYIPVGGAPQQWLFDTETRSWTTADYPAQFWFNRNGTTYFRTVSGPAVREDNGQLVQDVAGAVGQLTDEISVHPEFSDISSRWVSSWFRMPRHGAISYIRPTILSNGPLTITTVVLSNHDVNAADIAEATQTVTIQPDEAAEPNTLVSIDEVIGCDAVGDVFQITLEITASQAELVNVKVGVQ